MGDFIANGVSELWDGNPKQDAQAPTGAVTEWKAGDVNDIRQALLDLRDAVIGLSGAPLSFLAIPSSGQVDLSWAAVTGATGYTVYRSTVANGTRTAFTTASTSLSQTSLTNGTFYYYSVSATVNGVETARSPEVEAVPRTTFYVATTGNDSTGNGTIGTPWLTIGKARDYINTTYSGGGASLPTGGVTIMVRGGYYRQTATLTLDVPGVSGKIVEYRGYPGETARIGGGKPLTSWSAVTAGDSRYSRINGGLTGLYKASAGLTSYGGTTFPNYGDPDDRVALAELTFDGSMMALASWPKHGDNYIGVSDLSASTARPRTFTSDTSLPPNSHDWTSALAESNNMNKPWADIFTEDFRDDWYLVTAVSGTTITTTPNSSTDDFACTDAACYRMLNLLEELTDANEYWMDRTTGDVYMRTPSGSAPTSNEVLISEVENLVALSGAYIYLTELSIECAQRRLVNVGGSNNRIKNCTLKNSASHGINLTAASTVIDGCTFSDFGEQAVVFWTGSSSATIKESTFTRCGRYTKSYSSAMVGNTNGHTISHNEFSDLDWGVLYSEGSGFTIEYNLIDGALKTGADMGAVYFHWTGNSGTVIRYNVFQNIPRPLDPWINGSAIWGVYLDKDIGDGHAETDGHSIYGNIFYMVGDGTAAPGSGSKGGGVLNKGGNSVNNTTTYNLMLRVDIPYEASAYGGTAECTDNQAYVHNASFDLPTNNDNSTDPQCGDEAGGDFSNDADGGTYLYNDYRIPSDKVGNL